jgi:hypothetical protein
MKTLTEAQRTKHIEKLFQLNIETHLLIEIKDIQDELNIIASIFGEQRVVLNRLRKLCSWETSTEADSLSPSEIVSKQKRAKIFEDKSEEQSDSTEKSKEKGILHHNDEKKEAPVQDRRKGKKVHFPDEDPKDTDKETPILTNRSLVDDNIGIVLGNIRIMEDMQNYAAQVHTSVGTRDLRGLRVIY